ncbi:unnamed protein product [Closterium sp. NIES-53]
MAGNTSAGAGESSAQDLSGSQDSGVLAPRGARTNQGSLIKEVLKNFTVEKFNGEGYDDWAWKMQLYFRQIGLLKLMIGEEPRPSDPPLQEDWDERASAGYYLMSQSLELNQCHHVMHLLPEVDCGPKAWTVLKELHAPTSVVATLMLERELSALRLSEGEPVEPVLDKMRDLYAKLATTGITYPEQTKCLKMLSLLPESWLQFTSGLSLPQNQSLWTLEWAWTKILEEDFRRRQLRGGDDGSSGYGMQGSRRGRGRGFGGAGRGAKKDDDSNDQQGGTGWGRGAKSGHGGKSGAGGKMKGSCWYCEKEGHPWFLCYKKPDGWTPQNRHQDGGARRNQKNGANMVADSSDNNPKSNSGAEKKKECTAGQFFHIGEQGEQGDASAKVGAEQHPLDYWVLDTGTAWTMTPRKELLDDVRAAPINEVCSASGHALKVAGVGRAAFKGADGKLVVLYDVLLVPNLKANLISLRKLAKAGVSTSTDGARTYKGQLGNRVLWDLHESNEGTYVEQDVVGGSRAQVSVSCGVTNHVEHASRLVAKGFMQKEKQDFNEIFAPTAKPPTLRVLLADAAVSGKSIIQMDISTAFLNGVLEEDAYMTQPPGYQDGTGRVCKLKKSIYGLKQAPRCWYQKLAAVLEEIGFRTSSCDESLFLKGEGEKLVLFLVYVDDILLFISSMKEIQNVQQQLMNNFKCKTLREVKYYLGMHVERDLDHRVVQNPSEEQVDAAERVVKYLNSLASIGVQYSASAQVKQKGV